MPTHMSVTLQPGALFSGQSAPPALASASSAMLFADFLESLGVGTRQTAQPIATNGNNDTSLRKTENNSSTPAGSSAATSASSGATEKKRSDSGPVTASPMSVPPPIVVPGLTQQVIEPLNRAATATSIAGYQNDVAERITVSNQATDIGQKSVSAASSNAPSGFTTVAVSKQNNNSSTAPGSFTRVTELSPPDSQAEQPAAVTSGGDLATTASPKNLSNLEYACAAQLDAQTTLSPQTTTNSMPVVANAIDVSLPRIGGADSELCVSIHPTANADQTTGANPNRNPLPTDALTNLTADQVTNADSILVTPQYFSVAIAAAHESPAVSSAAHSAKTFIGNAYGSPSTPGGSLSFVSSFVSRADEGSVSAPRQAVHRLPSQADSVSITPKPESGFEAVTAKAQLNNVEAAAGATGRHLENLAGTPKSSMPGTHDEKPSPPKAPGDNKSNATQESTPSGQPAASLPWNSSTPLIALDNGTGSAHDPVSAQGNPVSVIPEAQPGVAAKTVLPSPVTVKPPDDLARPEAPAPVQAARIVQSIAQSEMHVGFRTESFGSVQVRTTLSEKSVEIALGSERGDLKTFMTSELPGLQSSLQQHDLRLQQIRTIAPSYTTQSDAFAGDSQQHSQEQRRSPAMSQIQATAEDSGETIVEVASGLSVRV